MNNCWPLAKGAERNYGAVMTAIRPFKPADAPLLANLFYQAIHTIAARHYSEAQVNAWAPAVPAAERFVLRGTDGRSLLVAVDDQDLPLAYGDLEKDGHIDHLFCSPEHAGTGLTAKLYDALERQARGWGLSRVYVEASEPAMRFFTKRGFTITERNDFRINEVPIHNFRMEKSLLAFASSTAIG